MEYCERTTAGLWAEPLNAVTNLAFIVTGVLLLRILLRRSARPVPWETVVLLFLVFSIGVGSSLWHTLATRWAEMADVLPITLYINVFLVSYLVRATRCGLACGVALFAAFHAANAGLAALLPLDTLNGSVFYLPAGATLIFMAVHARALGMPEHQRLLWASLVFGISLAFRSIDNLACDSWPVGTHFLWHVLNAFVLYATTRFVMAAHSTSRPTAGMPTP